jgi:predicted transcriptional regulator
MKRRDAVSSAIPLPTPAELEILSILWGLGPSTVREIHNAMSGKQTGYTTILKQMQVMVEKGLLERSERYRSHVYEARLPKEQTQRQLAGNLLQRAFEGSAKSLVMGALSAQKVSSAELGEIRRIIDDFEKGSR